MPAQAGIQDARGCRWRLGSYPTPSRKQALRRIDEIGMHGRSTAFATWHALLVVGLMTCCLGTERSIAQSHGEERSGWLTGRPLDHELAKPVNIAMNRTSPRQVVTRLRQLHRIALLLDRRIDPDQPIDVQFTQISLNEALESFANQLEGELARIGGTLYIGPPAEVDRIRTLIALKSLETRHFDGEDAVRRQFELARGTTLVWEDLAEPAALLEQVAEAFHVKRLAGETVPHDLWGAGAIVDLNATEALCLLLGQFDLTFAWRENGAAIEIVPAPETVTVEREHRPRSISVAEAIEAVTLRWPDLSPQPRARSFTVAATAGQHDAIAELISPGRSAPEGPPASQGPLSRRRFTLDATRAEAIAVLRTLQSQDVVVEYDAEVLQQAGIDLRTKVSLELDQATAEELLTQLCEPLGLRFEIDGKTVRLSPAVE